MRKLIIITGQFDLGGGRFVPEEHPCDGLTKSQDIARELVSIAGWPADTGFGVMISETTDEFMDVDFEDDRKQAELIGNTEYGYRDADSESRGWEPLNPHPGESHAFVLKQRINFN